MLSTALKKFSIVTPFKGTRAQSGQAVLEYILVIIVVLSIFVIAAKPAIGKLGKKINEGLQAGIFKDDPSGSGFYYYPVK